MSWSNKVARKSRVWSPRPNEKQMTCERTIATWTTPNKQAHVVGISPVAFELVRAWLEGLDHVEGELLTPFLGELLVEGDEQVEIDRARVVCESLVQIIAPTWLRASASFAPPTLVKQLDEVVIRGLENASYAASTSFHIDCMTTSELCLSDEVVTAPIMRTFESSGLRAMCLSIAALSMVPGQRIDSMHKALLGIAVSTCKLIAKVATNWMGQAIKQKPVDLKIMLCNLQLETLSTINQLWGKQ